jgi:uncharacterized membrane protein
MLEAPLHPKIVHVPIALSVLMPLVAIGLLVAWWSDWLPGRTWWLAVALQAILFGGGWVAVETGEEDEEKVEAIVPESAIETHEERAEQFFWGTAGGLILMVLPAVVPGRRRKRWLAVLASAGTLVVLVLGYRVGEAGGALVYEHGAANAHIEAPPASSPESDSPSDSDLETREE